MKFILICLFQYILAHVKIDLYSKSEVLEEEIKNIIKDCKGSLKELTNNSDNTLKAYDYSNNSNNKKIKVFFLAGEHPRELISVEVMFHFIKNICKINNPVLDNFHIRIIYNANPESRNKVIAGDYCKRTNPNNIDINRNWDYEFGKNIELDEEYPGTSPFSEKETKFIYDLISEFKPELFLSLHSGVFSLFHPYAFHKKDGERNIQFMKNALNQIKNKFCSKCDMGAPGNIIGYISSGTCMDFIYDKLKVPKVLVWEIFTDDVEFPEIRKRKNFFKFKSENNIQEKYERIKNIDKKIMRKEEISDNENIDCFKMFNPNDKKTFEGVKEIWKNALINLLEFIKDNNN